MVLYIRDLRSSTSVCSSARRKCTLWLSRMLFPKAFLCRQYSAVSLITLSIGKSTVEMKHDQPDNVIFKRKKKPNQGNQSSVAVWLTVRERRQCFLRHISYTGAVLISKLVPHLAISYLTVMVNICWLSLVLNSNALL